MYERGKSYVSDFYINGVRFGPKTLGRKSAMTRTEAKRKEAEWKREARLGLRRKGTAHMPRFADFSVEWLSWYATGKRGGSVRIVGGKLKLLNETFGTTPLDTITEVMIERYKRDRAKGVKPRTVNNDIDLLRHVFRTAMRWGYLVRDPSAEVKRLPVTEERPRVLTDDEALRLLDACSAKLRPLVQFALHTGLRYEELAKLTSAQIDLRCGTVTVEGGLAKNRKRRSVPLTHGAREALDAAHQAPQGSERVFGYLGDVPEWRQPLYQAAKRAGIVGVHPHTLRHSFATNCLEKGVNLRTVQRWLGHSSSKMTERYTNPTEAHEREAILVLDAPSPNFRLQHVAEYHS